MVHYHLGLQVGTKVLNLQIAREQLLMVILVKVVTLEMETLILTDQEIIQQTIMALIIIITQTLITLKEVLLIHQEIKPEENIKMEIPHFHLLKTNLRVLRQLQLATLRLLVVILL